MIHDEGSLPPSGHQNFEFIKKEITYTKNKKTYKNINSKTTKEFNSETKIRNDNW